MLYVRLIILMLSFLGYILFAHKKLSLEIEFIPALICSSFSGILFCAGLINILPYASLLIFGGGLFLFGGILKKGGIPSNSRDKLLLIIGGIVLGYFILLLNNSHFTHFDNFSHWATVVKDILMTNRMPNFQDDIVLFQAYPLGSALFIYYICQVLGNSDACLILSQTIMVLSFLFPIFAFIKKKNAGIVCLAVFFCIYSMISNIPIYDLLVDTLMPLAGVSAIAIIYYYRDKSNGKLQEIVLLMPLLFFLINVKNSGIFFASICMIMFTYLNRPILLKSRKLLTAFIGYDLLVPIGGQFLWKRHVEFAFAAGETSKHAMSLGNFKEVLSEKTYENVIEIGKNLIHRSISMETKGFKIMLIISLILALIILWHFKLNALTEIRKDIMCFVGCWTIFIVYLILLYAMYLFSMPMFEASYLAGYDRYLESAVVFIYGISIIYILDSFNNMLYRKVNKISSYVVLGLLLVLVSFSIWPYKINLSTLYKKQEYLSTERYPFQKLKQDYDVKDKKKYFIYCSDYGSGYLYYLARYELWSNDVVMVDASTFENTKWMINDRDYLIIWDQDSVIQAYLIESGLEKYIGTERTVIDLYSITNQ